MARNVSVAALNFAVRPIEDFAGFAEHVKALLAGCEGADLVVFPELLTVELFTALPDWRRRPVADLPEIAWFTDDYLELFTKLATERDQYLVGGSHLVPHGGAYRNVAHLFTPDGDVLTHAKTHIFPAEADWSTVEGDGMTVFELPFATVGVNICYEAEIPECATALTRQGAEILLCPSYTFTEHGFWRVRHSVQARAIENQLYVVHACAGGNPGGPLAPGWAQASVVGPCDTGFPPNGVLAETTVNTESVARTVLDLDLLARNRETGAAPTCRDRRRRAEAYGDWLT